MAGVVASQVHISWKNSLVCKRKRKEDLRDADWLANENTKALFLIFLLNTGGRGCWQGDSRPRAGLAGGCNHS
jgi:hypothetical protein